MNQNQDAFGKHLLAQYCKLLKGEPITAEIVERDDQYIDLGSMSRLYFSEYNEWSELEQDLIDRAEGKILDIGCGAGRHSLYLQGKGLDITGIDKSSGAIEVSKLRGLEEALVRPIEEIDEFEPNTFDTIIMFGNNFGLFGSAENAKQILAKMYRITTPNAKIIAQSLNPYMTDDEVHLRYHERNRKLGRMAGQIRLRIRYKMYIGEWFDYLFVSPEEMQEIVNDTNWRISEIVKNDGANYFAIIEKNP